MSRRNDNECAYCAEIIPAEKGLIGNDWKVYCSHSCRQAGERISLSEFDQIMETNRFSLDSQPA